MVWKPRARIWDWGLYWAILLFLSSTLKGRDMLGRSRSGCLLARAPANQQKDNHDTNNRDNYYCNNNPDEHYRREKRTEQRTRLNLLQSDSYPAGIKSLLRRSSGSIQKTAVQILLGQDEGNGSYFLNRWAECLKGQRSQSSAVIVTV